MLKLQRDAAPFTLPTLFARVNAVLLYVVLRLIQRMFHMLFFVYFTNACYSFQFRISGSSNSQLLSSASVALRKTKWQLREGAAILPFLHRKKSGMSPPMHK